MEMLKVVCVVGGLCSLRRQDFYITRVLYWNAGDLGCERGFLGFLEYTFNLGDRADGSMDFRAHIPEPSLHPFDLPITIFD